MLRRSLAIAGRLAAWVWASPYTALGLLIGAVGLLGGGHARRRGPVVEFYGGAAALLLRCLPGGNAFVAMTLGHTIIGRTAAALDLARPHELVHVRQFERWGPLMGPAYLLCSLVLWLARWDPYRDNPFERQARAMSGER